MAEKTITLLDGVLGTDSFTFRFHYLDAAKEIKYEYLVLAMNVDDWPIKQLTTSDLPTMKF